jgi:hypothetical protein
MIQKVYDVVILCWGAPADADRRARAIAGFVGVEGTVVVLSQATCTDGATLQALVPQCNCLIVHAETLARAAEALPNGAWELADALGGVAPHVFVHGFLPGSRHDALLAGLSADSLLGVRPARVGAPSFEAVKAYRRWAGQFSGLSFGEVASRDRVFLEGPGALRRDVILRAAGAPFLVCVQRNGAQLFFSGCEELADLDAPVGRAASPLVWFSRLVPLMMFLRAALASRVWHNLHPQACFIIDDPTLTNRYGFLNYGRLVEAMRHQRFVPCIAFIPWNYRRSHPPVAGLISWSYGVPYLCVHGCDHTRAEFATTDGHALYGKARLALERMQAHTRLTGAPFDDVMVFPQGLFSVEALAALRNAGYLAAVNSDLRPSTGDASLSLRDEVDVAVTRFGGFPLFGRRYPRDIAEVAWDLFMGKPALAVEHHGYFQHGYTALQSFVAAVNALDERLEWTNLGAICSQASLTRTSETGDAHVKFFGTRFSLANRSSERRHYVVGHPLLPEASLFVSVNGVTTAPGKAPAAVIGLSLESGQTALMRLSPAVKDVPSTSWKRTARHNLGVRIRRYLSEVRDNHVDTNPILHGLVAMARNGRLVRTSG